MARGCDGCWFCGVDGGIPGGGSDNGGGGDVGHRESKFDAARFSLSLYIFTFTFHW